MIKWFKDEQAKKAHMRMDEYVSKMCAELFHGHLFTHSGFNRNDNTDEIVIKLHLRPIGEAVWINQRLNQLDAMRLEKKND